MAQAALDDDTDVDKLAVHAHQALVGGDAKKPFDPVDFVQTYMMESCFMAFFVLCFVVLFFGKRHNAAIAEMWHAKSLPLIKEQFACVGMEDGRLNVDLE